MCDWLVKLALHGDYKQLWCAPLGRDAAWEITLSLNKPTTKHNATLESTKPTMWLLAKAYRVTQLCDLPDFPSKAIGCGKQGGDGEGRVDNQKD